MATLTVWQFPTPQGADEAEQTLGTLQKQELIQVIDAATVSWPPDKKRPKTRQLNSPAGAGALGGSFWGLLFGLIFFVPLLGMAVGAAAGALSGSLTDVGIDDDFIRTVRDKLKPGSSALFVLTEGAVVDRVHEAFEGSPAQLIASNLSTEEEATLREVFTEA